MLDELKLLAIVLVLVGLTVGMAPYFPWWAIALADGVVLIAILSRFK